MQCGKRYRRFIGDACAAASLLLEGLRGLALQDASKSFYQIIPNNANKLMVALYNPHQKCCIDIVCRATTASCVQSISVPSSCLAVHSHFPGRSASAGPANLSMSTCYYSADQGLSLYQFFHIRGRLIFDRVMDTRAIRKSTIKKQRSALGKKGRRALSQPRLAAKHMRQLT